MATSSISSRLAVCSWSLQPASAADLVEKLAGTGITQIQVALDPIREKAPGWETTPEYLASQGVTCVSGMFGTVGEDYTTLETIRCTGGIVPDHTWEENWRNIQAGAELAQRMGLKFVSFHAGFLPHEESDPAFATLFERMQRVAEVYAKREIALGCETGQETAETLRAFLEKLNAPHVGVNFDPANMILYDKGDPIAALRTLGPWLRQCHLKDANRTKAPGTWGEEVVLGTGQVNWPAFFAAHKELGFAGYCCIEREAGHQRAADIRTAKDFVEKLNP